MGTAVQVIALLILGGHPWTSMGFVVDFFTRSTRHASALTPLQHMLPASLVDVPTITAAATKHTDILSSSFITPTSFTTFLTADIDYVELSKTVGLWMLGVFGFFAALTYLTVNVLMPQAAQQVQEQILELDPSLWDAYQQKLRPGESMAQRPDLIQELGQKVLELQQQQFEQRAELRDDLYLSETRLNDWSEGAVNAEIIIKEKKIDNKE
jgi:hypothetical protein